MKTRILINGAQGKMGQLAVKTILNTPDFELVGQTGRKDSLSKEITQSKAEVVIDLTNAEAVFNNTKTILECGVKPVIGTSGLVHDQVQLLKERARQLKLGGIIAPNFSLGAILMMKCAKNIAAYLPTAEIIEMHHPGKLDSPSATALRTAELINQHRKATPGSIPTREIQPGARGATYQTIPIHSIRLPGLIAHQQIIFGGEAETLTIRHDTMDRQCFMPGIVFACRKVIELKELIYGLEDLL